MHNTYPEIHLASLEVLHLPRIRVPQVAEVAVKAVGGDFKLLSAEDLRLRVSVDDKKRTKSIRGSIERAENKAAEPP